MPTNGNLPRLILFTLAGVLLVLFLHSFLYHYFPDILQPGYFSADEKREGAEPRAIQARGNLAEDEKSTIELFENSRDSVVFITTRQRVMDAWTRNIFSVPSGTGSGFIWDDHGHIITNLHVIKGASEATVRLAQALSIPVIASGGLSSVADVEKLCGVEGEGVIGSIAGRAIYDGTLDFKAAQAAADKAGR